MTRTLLVHISGNRATWDNRGQHGGMWQINPDRATSIFADTPLPSGNPTTTTVTVVGPEPPGAASSTLASSSSCCEQHHAALTDRLSRAMLRSVTILESNTNVDEVLSVHVDGLPPREYTCNGEGASLFLTGEGRVTQPQVIFSMSGNSELGLQWMRQFPRYTSENLETEGVMFLTGASYYFVHQDHPVIHFLKANEEQLGIVCLQEPSLEGGWIRIDLESFVYTVRTLRETVLRNTPSTFNLTQMTVRIGKPDGQRWRHVCPQLIRSLLPEDVRESDDPDALAEARQLVVKRYFDQPLFVTLRVCIEYALPEVSSSPTSAPPPPPMMMMPPTPQSQPPLPAQPQGSRAGVKG